MHHGSSPAYDPPRRVDDTPGNVPGLLLHGHAEAPRSPQVGWIDFSDLVESGEPVSWENILLLGWTKPTGSRTSTHLNPLQPQNQNMLKESFMVCLVWEVPHPELYEPIFDPIILVWFVEWKIHHHLISHKLLISTSMKNWVINSTKFKDWAHDEPSHLEWNGSSNQTCHYVCIRDVHVCIFMKSFSFGGESFMKSFHPSDATWITLVLTVKH